MGPIAVFSLRLEILSFWERVCLKSRWGRTLRLHMASKIQVEKLHLPSRVIVSLAFTGCLHCKAGNYEGCESPSYVSAVDLGMVTPEPRSLMAEMANWWLWVASAGHTSKPSPA